MTHSHAGTLALGVLTWLVTRQQVDGLLTASGLSPAELRARAEQPELLAGVLAYLLSREDLAAEYCGSESVSAQDLHAAQLVLGEAR